MKISPNIIYPISAQASPELLLWLEHETTSLTQKLTQITGLEPYVSLIKQGWERSSYWDKYFLNITSDLVLKRDIFMTLKEKKCWYAKTIIPSTCYQLDNYFFERLENGPLTPLVFNEPRVKRVQLFHYPIDHNCIEFYWVQSLYKDSIESTLWVRCSHFVFLERESFFLIEVFLPNFLQVINNE